MRSNESLGIGSRVAGTKLQRSCNVFPLVRFASELSATLVLSKIALIDPIDPDFTPYSENFEIFRNQRSGRFVEI